jgi:hypothetical protein
MSTDLEQAKEIARELLVDDDIRTVELAIAGGVIPEAPGAAYRLGLEHGRKAAVGGLTSDANCWACGKPRAMPDHAAQARELAEMHYAHSSPWHWAPAEFEVTREILDEMGPTAYLDAIISRRPFYGSVRIVKPDRSVVDINRRVLLQRVKERES